MSNIELMKMRAELLRVQAAKAEMQYTIAQRLEEIERLEMNVKKQEETEFKLIQKMKE